MNDVLEGGCLCGQVRYRIESEPMVVGHCFCTSCRRASGTSHGTHAGVPDAAFLMTGETRSYESAADSGNMVSRDFCPSCGSAIFSRNASMPGMTFVRVSSLDDPNRVEPQMTVYASRAPSWAMLDRSKPVFSVMPEGGPAAAVDQARQAN